MNGHTKNFALISDVDTNFSWSIKLVVYENEIIKNLGEIVIQDNKEGYVQRREQQREYSKEHSDDIKNIVQKWRGRNGEQNRETQRQWRRNNPKKTLEYMKKYRRTDKGKRYMRKCNARRKGYGFREINYWSIGTVGHHINDDEIVYIPGIVHRMFQTGEKEKHRELIKEWLRNIRPDLYLRCYA